MASEELLSIKQASEWATKHIGKTVTTSNISYLIQYGRVRKIGDNGSTQISKQKLILPIKKKKEIVWKDWLGDDPNWVLLFAIDNFFLQNIIISNQVE